MKYLGNIVLYESNGYYWVDFESGNYDYDVMFQRAGIEFDDVSELNIYEKEFIEHITWNGEANDRIETKRLILRPWQENDAEELYNYAKDERVGPIAGWPVHTSVENSREIIQNVLSKEGTYAVILKETQLPVGSIGLMIGKESNLEISDREAEIGYWIGVPYWGQGLIPEAMRELMRYAFDDLHMEKLWCGYFEGNEKSRSVQEKCGFIYHHTNENIYWELMDDIRTEHITSITPEQWDK